ncbi:MAG: hypothetical protein DWQ18_06835 [Crenarchaeota archaeon]|nr:MAG: hypothetical protein DWQ17_02950 [Thermoproteota archaeon]RDJ32898.1 MAG: hypothetical protein DWQ18_06835 [Thermoproteota archaeon]RDJ36020.1 MAG: hypothetical protein DWQ13_09035 [Thermoproteota archaeon]RDJ38268.1 MAG: hypothetical protein DWQ19_00340 [Thermoproteota archaeon]
MKKKKIQNIVLASIAVIIISGVVGYNYYIDQVKIKGFTFGNEIQQIQEELKKSQDEFLASEKMLKNEEISKEEFLEVAEKHTAKMQELILRYDSLSPPEPFKASVDLLKLSTQTQLEAENLIISWAKTGNTDDLLRADAIFQEAFEYEMAGLSEFNAVKAGIKP